METKIVIRFRKRSRAAEYAEKLKAAKIEGMTSTTVACASGGAATLYVFGTFSEGVAEGITEGAEATRKLR